MTQHLHLRTLDHMLEGCQIIGPDWRYLYVNAAAAQQGMRSPEQLVGRTMMEAYPGIDETHLFTLLRRCMDEGVPAELENEFALPDGSRSWFALRIQAVPEGVFVLSIDISERVRMERRENRAQRLESLGVLASGVAHDLNNALAPIRLGVELLRLDHPGAEELAAMFESSAQRATSMVRQLLTFARGSDGQRTPTKPAALLAEIEQFMVSFPRSIRFEASCAEGLPLIRVDATQIHQVLLNLCVNARDAMPDGGALRVDVRLVEVDEVFASAVLGARPGKFVSFRVRDTGTGIPTEVLDHIFEPFFTTKGPTLGTGLGLSTTLGIIKGHEGFIHVYSEAGAGTTFKVYLPVDGAGATAAAEPTALGDFMGSGEVILVVDDDARMREAVRNALGGLNFVALPASDGADALAEIAGRRTEISAVILDVHMPRMDGFAFAAMLPEVLPGTPIIVASGALDETTSARLDAMGLIQRIEKPFTQAALGAALRDVLRDVRG
ncbi:MAG: hybrid sensor histidine kinase/response regulator [Gemmatimonadaceae bacterium]